MLRVTLRLALGAERNTRLLYHRDSIGIRAFRRNRGELGLERGFGGVFVF